MSDPSRDSVPSDDVRYVVDVTAPLSPGRVRFVAAEAAARLQLPVEKLVGLLENRIGPVTKPLARASAERVAEVLDLAGAEVALRKEGDDPPAAVDGSVPASATATASAREPGAGGEEEVSPPAASARPPGEETRDANEDALEPEGAEDAPKPARPPVEADGAASAGDPPDVDPTPPTPPHAGSGSHAWSAVDDEWGEDDEPDPMLGRWTAPARRSEEVPTEAPTAPASQRPPRPTPNTEAAPPTPERREAAVREVPVVPSYQDADDREPTWQVGSQGDGKADFDDEDAFDAFDPAWGYGTRDPFREAERQAVVQRRWALGIALLVALAVFLGLQWAYSDRDPAGASAPPFAEGLEAYRQGAFVSASRAWRPRAEAGDARAMYMLGYMAQWGQGRPWSNADAASWYREAAERGSAPAQRELGRLRLEGMGGPRDPDLALRWFEAAARQGDAVAAFEAGRLLLRRARFEEALLWFREAADRHPDAAAWAAFMNDQAALNARSD